MIKNIKMNVKTQKISTNGRSLYQLMAEAYARAEGLYDVQLTFINVANSK